MRALLLTCALALLASSTALASPVVIKNRRIERDQTLAHALHALPLPNEQVDAVIGALRGTDFDFRKIRPGDQLRFVYENGELDRMDIRQNTESEWHVRRDGDRYLGSKRAVEVAMEVATVELSVTYSLWEAAVSAGERPDIAMALSDVFAWDIDFYQDVRPGDRARAVIEKYTHKGRLLRYGDVLAAEYRGEQVGHKRVFRFEHQKGHVSYFQEDGNSARKSFLKSPLKFASVTSRFGNRFHPVLQYMKAHNGVDYGAAIGTPVWAVADGTVTTAGYAGANGNLLCIRHMNSFETCYAHLSRIAVRPGQRVAQKQVVAYTGNTGRSTGPHLHYALKRGGAFVNPLNQNFPRAEPVEKSKLPEFQEAIAPLVEKLNQERVAHNLAATSAH